MQLPGWGGAEAGIGAAAGNSAPDGGSTPYQCIYFFFIVDNRFNGTMTREHGLYNLNSLKCVETSLWAFFFSSSCPPFLSYY